jgi:alpha/beta superfamily hydrolase
MGFEKINITPESQEQQKVRIAWKSKATGAEGHGEYMDMKTAEAWLEKANKEYPELEHWLESEDEAK